MRLSGLVDLGVHVNLRGFDPSGQTMDPAEVVRRFLDALHVPPERIPVDPDAQAALYRSQLAGKRMLIVLDNARDSAQVRPLLPGAPTLAAPAAASLARVPVTTVRPLLAELTRG